MWETSFKRRVVEVQGEFAMFFHVFASKNRSVYGAIRDLLDIANKTSSSRFSPVVEPERASSRYYKG
jgi:hypothetical protein